MKRTFAEAMAHRRSYYSIGCLLYTSLHGMNDRIEFKDLSFSYDGKREVLKHVNLMVPKGQTIALVGQSGDVYKRQVSRRG